jgi:hypothetical protein
MLEFVHAQYAHRYILVKLNEILIMMSHLSLCLLNLIGLIIQHYQDKSQEEIMTAKQAIPAQLIAFTAIPT